MKAGAVDFLPKPFKSRELLKCVEQALDRSAKQRHREAAKNEARHLLDLLTPREFEVMQLVITGMLKDRKSTRLNSSHRTNSYAVFCLKKKNSTRVVVTLPAARSVRGSR